MGPPKGSKTRAQENDRTSMHQVRKARQVGHVPGNCHPFKGYVSAEAMHEVGRPVQL